MQFGLRDSQWHLSFSLHALEVILDPFLLKLARELVEPRILVYLNVWPLRLFFKNLSFLLPLLPII